MRLSDNWITENHIDFEYKKYMLLAYLQEVHALFSEQKLYPSLADLIQHYRNLLAIRENKQSLHASFPGRIKGPDLENLKMIYEKMIQDDAMMKELEQIIEFSLPRLKHSLSDGKKVYDFIEENMRFSPVGIMPLDPSEGYLLIRTGKNRDTRVYEYQITLFENPDEKYRGIHVSFLANYEGCIGHTAETVKSALLKDYEKLPNPAVYAAETDMVVPVEETLLPVAKRALVRYVASAA